MANVIGFWDGTADLVSSPVVDFISCIMTDFSLLFSQLPTAKTLSKAPSEKKNFSIIPF